MWKSRFTAKRGTAPTKVARTLLFLIVSSLGLLGLRLLPATVSDGWLPATTLLAALGLLTAALITAVKSR